MASFCVCPPGPASYQLVTACPGAREHCEGSGRHGSGSPSSVRAQAAAAAHRHSEPGLPWGGLSLPRR